MSQDDAVYAASGWQGGKPDLAGYELNYLLGRGRFGEVWAGTQRSTGQAVAVKVFLDVDLEIMRRQLDGLREVSRQPGVVDLLDADLNHYPAYLVMPLQVDSLAESETPGPDLAASWMSQLAAGLRHGHDKGLAHCDLKPSNVLREQSGGLQLADFGQSRQTEGGLEAWGTPGFMAPEQSGPPDPAWDVYGLGATIYRLLTGFCPYWSEAELRELCAQPLATRLRRYRQQIQIAPLIPVRKVNSKVDQDLADLVQACLAFDPVRRPADMSAILEDLERRRLGRPLLCRRPWGRGYLVNRWARRPFVAAASLATIILIGSVAYYYTRVNLANLERQLQVEAMVVQQAGQSEPEEAQLWRCRALERNSEDPVLRTQLAREHFGLQAYSSLCGGWTAIPDRPELIQWMDSKLLIWREGKSVALQLAFKPNRAVGAGSRLAVLGAEGAAILDLDSLKARTDLPLNERTRDAAWDGETLVVLDSRGVSRWSREGRRLGQVQHQGDRLSPDGRWLYAPGRLTELASGRWRRLPVVEKGQDEELFSPGSSWLRLGNRLVGLKSQPDWTLPGGFACFVDEQRVAVMDGSQLSIVSHKGSRVRLQGSVEARQVSAGRNFLLVAGAGDDFSLWDSRNGAQLTSKRLQRVGRKPRQLLFNGDASLLLADNTAVCKIWRLDPPRPLWSLIAPGQVLELAWSEAQDWLWVGSARGLLRLSAEGKQLEELRWSRRARSYAFSAQGAGLVELDGGIRAFWPGHEENLAEYAPGQFETSCPRVFFSADGATALASLPGLLKVWQVRGQHLQPLREVAIAEPPQQLAFSAGGHYVAALCGNLGNPRLKLGVWRLPELRGVPLDLSEIANEGRPLQLAFDPSEEWLLVGCAGRFSVHGLHDRTRLSGWRTALDLDAPCMLGAGWLLESDSQHSLQKIGLPGGQKLAPCWPQPIEVSALEHRGDLGFVSNLYDTSLLDLGNGQTLSPGLGVGGLTHLRAGRSGLLGSLEDRVGLWVLSQTTATPEALTRRWESLTAKRLDLERSRVIELSPQEWTAP